ncbi:MAG: TetR/AcrR family transcriptional regulator [Myxococcales bacterium]|nr:TetR/AcrR family transcriptional regulator [Myxococcales bacterium]
MHGLAEAIEAMPFDQITTAEIVRRSRTSKRTFYEHFSTKADCFLALYDELSIMILAVVREAIAQAPPGAERIRLGTAAYLAALQQRPGLARTLLLEIVRLGPEGERLRRRVLQAYAELLAEEFTASGVPPTQAALLSRVLVGGISELVLEAAELQGIDSLRSLSEGVVEVLEAFLAVGRYSTQSGV